jgi:flagellin
MEIDPMSDVTLSAAVRQSLLSLQGTTDLIERTQNRLSTGLRVGSAIDDPVAFFQAKSLSDRASDFLEKKDAIDQGISTVTAALDGVEGIEALVRQMKGISNSMKSATDAQIADLVTQFNDLRSQINNLAADASYQGTNLINGEGQTLSVEFSEKSASLLNVSSVDIRSDTTGLNIVANAYFTGDDSITHSTQNFSTAADKFDRFAVASQDDFSITYNGSDATFSAGDTLQLTYGTGSSLTLQVATGQGLTLSNGGAVTINFVTSTTAIGATELGVVTTGNVAGQFLFGAQAALSGNDVGTAGAITFNGDQAITVTTSDTIDFTFGTGTETLVFTTAQTITAGEVLNITVLGSAASVTANTGVGYIQIAGTDGVTAGAQVTSTTAANYQAAVQGIYVGTDSITANNAEIVFDGLVSAGDTSSINNVIDQLDSALTTLRTQSQTLGSNVALLNTRLSFTENYVNTLQGGSDKLTLADINEEGANLLALQTRQQLGIQSLSLAAQAEASILSLFG